MMSALCVGFLLDLLIGDPLWLPHPVQAIGWLIARLEKPLRRTFPQTARGELAAGGVMVLLVCLAGFGVPLALLSLAGAWHPAARWVLSCIMSWQVLAVKGLRDAGMRIYRPLAAGDLPAARRAVAMVVGRDTDHLDAGGVARAAVETVAENTGDGVAAPMLFFALGGPSLAFLYKAVNTMDSMVGYRNERYLYFGRVAARLDDAANYLPARLSGLLMVAAAFLCGLNGREAWRVLWRDRYRHSSPNSAWPEAACAGALGVRLGGASIYGGVVVEKPAIGDGGRETRPEDILAVRRLALAAAMLCLALCLGIIFLRMGGRL